MVNVSTLMFKNGNIDFNTINEIMAPGDCLEGDAIYSKFELALICGIKFWKGHIGNEFTLISPYGIELIGPNLHKQFCKEYIAGKVAGGSKRELAVVCKYIAKSAAHDPKIVEHIPNELFFARETLGEEILTEYQALKLEELKHLPAAQDPSGLVEEVKTNVANMNKTFNKVEKSREVNNGFKNLCARDRNV